MESPEITGLMVQQLQEKRRDLYVARESFWLGAERLVRANRELTRRSRTGRWQQMLTDRHAMQTAACIKARTDVPLDNLKAEGILAPTCLEVKKAYLDAQLQDTLHASQHASPNWLQGQSFQGPCAQRPC